MLHCYLFANAAEGSLGVLALGVDAADVAAVHLALIDIRAHATHILPEHCYHRRRIRQKRRQRSSLLLGVRN